MEKKSRKSIIVGITVLLLVTVTLLGLTYAYYRTRVIGNDKEKSISVTSKLLEITYNDGSSTVNMEGKIEPGFKYTKQFSVENTGDDTVNYGVYLENLVNEFKRTSDWKLTVTCTSNISGKTCNGVTETDFPRIESLVATNEIEEDEIQTYEMEVEYLYLEEDQSVDMGASLSAKIQIYDLTNTFKENTLAYNIVNNASNKQNGTALVNEPLSKVAEQVSPGVYKKLISNDEIATYGAKSLSVSNQQLVVNALTNGVDKVLGACFNASYQPTGAEGCYDASLGFATCESVKGKYIYNIDEAMIWHVDNCSDKGMELSSGLIGLNNKDYPTLDSNLFVKEEESEKVLSASLDDNGISFYYRGYVKDNYVNFAGMCWKIIRIQGDGSVKLILEDQNALCNGSDYTGNWNIGTGNYGYEEKNIDSDSYVEKIMSYLEPKTNANSSMVKAFYDFQTTELKDYTSKLKAGDWCLSADAYTRNSTKPYIYTPLEQYDYASNIYYESYTRLTNDNSNGYNPTLKCNGTKLDKFLDVVSDGETITSEAPMYVSAITADEIVYAGGKYETSNYGYYLINDYQERSTSFWTLTPSYFYRISGKYSPDRIFKCGYNGGVYNQNVNWEYDPTLPTTSFRPVVVLSSNTLLTSGDGTQTNPYVVE